MQMEMFNYVNTCALFAAADRKQRAGWRTDSGSLGNQNQWNVQEEKPLHILPSFLETVHTGSDGHSL